MFKWGLHRGNAIIEHEESWDNAIDNKSILNCDFTDRCYRWFTDTITALLWTEVWIIGGKDDKWTCQERN